jgi:hypothetical protein
MMSTVDLAGARWRKSSYSSGTGGGNDSCVEVAFVAPAVAVRDSKNAAGPVLALPNGAWTRFIHTME